MHDLKPDFRRPRTRPGWVPIAALALVLFIGVNLAVFAVIDAVLLRYPLFPTPDQLVTLFKSSTKG